MPHTRDIYIVFSKNYFESLYNKFSSNEEFLKSNREIVKLIAHEQFHIFQRWPHILLVFFELLFGTSTGPYFDEIFEAP